MTRRERRQELGELLRSRREGLRPEDLGLPRGERRRARGLRRDEVAAASGVSVSWYTWLEQGRRIHPSANALRRICKALRLTEAEHEYVSLLTEKDVREQSNLGTEDYAGRLAAVQSTLDALGSTPALLYNGRFDIVAANPAASAIYLGGGDSGSWDRNMVWRFFMDEERRDLYPDGTSDRGVRNLIEALRLNRASPEGGDSVNELIDELRTRSFEFDAIWKEHCVARLSMVPGRVRLDRRSSPIRVNYTRFYVPTMPGCAMAVLMPASAEEAAILERHIDRIA